MPSSDDEPTDRPGPATDDADPDAGSAARRLLSDVVIGAGIIVIIVLVFFALSGVWPPFVAIESGSMEPHMSAGDLVYLVEPDRYTSQVGAGGAGLLTLEEGSTNGHMTFGQPGHVVVFEPNGGEGTPIIHRLHLHVEAGENWYDRANPEFVGQHRECDSLPNCPAPHTGFVTKGDANAAYDQVNGDFDVVREEWITGRALVRIPYLGSFRVGR